ncbi:hypothetical protein ACIQCF_37485 [Streptomyces sp. NPDC088353]|uniref:hypothetical protein n=1 Tax=Streptomyces sp. NPDC088353 TaxID=3365855 RepID=UPI0037F7BEA8
MDDSQRFYLTVTAAGRLVMQGWWGSEATARRKFSLWAGEYGTMSGARITLIDEGQGQTVTTWPDEA